MTLIEIKGQVEGGSQEWTLVTTPVDIEMYNMVIKIVDEKTGDYLEIKTNQLPGI